LSPWWPSTSRGFFATARRYARRESEIEDIVQEGVHQGLPEAAGFPRRGAFEHWLMRLTVRTCYDFPAEPSAQPGDEFLPKSATRKPTGWSVSTPIRRAPMKGGCRQGTHRPGTGTTGPEARLVITLLEIEDKSIKGNRGADGVVAAAGEGGGPSGRGRR